MFVLDLVLSTIRHSIVERRVDNVKFKTVLAVVTGNKSEMLEDKRKI